MIKSAKNVQQMFAENEGLRGIILSDLYVSEEIESLENKLEILFPHYKFKEDEILNDKSISVSDRKKKIEDLNKYNNQMIKKRTLLKEKIWSQRKYSNGELLSSTIFVIFTPNITDDIEKLAQSTEFSCHPLIRIRKCFVGINDSENCCTIFVDENGRVYQNWKDFIENNTFPKGVIIVPENGIYHFTAKNEVILEYFQTPPCSTFSKGIKIIDNTALLCTLAGTTVHFTAILLRVPPPVVALSTLMLQGSTAWGIGRAAGKLIDRAQHEQSINFKDPQARLSWLTIGCGSLTLASNVATKILTTCAANGIHVSVFTRGAINGINIASFVVNGVGLGNSAYNVGWDTNGLDVFLLGMSVCVFTHSALSFRYSSTIIQNTQTPIGFGNDNKILQSTAVKYVTSKIKLIQAIMKTLTTICVKNEVNLVNTLIQINKTLSDDAVDYLAKIAKSFIEERLGRARAFPFEQVSWDLFQICKKTARLHNIVIDKNYLEQNNALLLIELQDLYERRIREPIGQSIKCKICKGFYRISPIS